MNFLFELITTRFHEKLIPNFQTNLENIQKLYIFEIAKVLIRAHEPISSYKFCCVFVY